MQLVLNYAHRSASLVPALVAIFAGIATAAVAISIWLVVDTHRRSDDRAALVRKLEHWQARVAATPAPELPAAAAVNDLKVRVAAVNALRAGEGEVLTAVLDRLARALPDSVYIERMSFRAANGEIGLIVESDNAASLTAFLLKLQQEPAFTQALLARQDQRMVQGRKRVQFELRLKQAHTAIPR